MNKKFLVNLMTVLVVFAISFLPACRPGEPISSTESPRNTHSATPDPTSSGQGEIPNPFAPQPGDENLNRGKVELDKKEFMIMESDPVQITVHLEGSLPTPCHQLRVSITEEGNDEEIKLEVYSVADPDQMCAQVLEPFEANIPLGSYEKQGVGFWVNGEEIGEY